MEENEMNYEEKQRLIALRDNMKSYGYMDGVEELESTFPELRESEDERIRKDIMEAAENWLPYERVEEIRAYLEKQKYDRMKPVYDNQDSFESALEKAWKDYNDSGARTVDGCEDDYVECAHAKGFREGYLFGLEKQKEPENVSASTMIPSCWAEEPSLQKEQEQASTKDMPYAADEHFYEQEPVDSFKYRLAEYMTKNCTGHSYNISSESILQMAKEELIKRGKLKELKPAEWSEEDEARIERIAAFMWRNRKGDTDDIFLQEQDVAWLKSLRSYPIQLKEAYKDGFQTARHATALAFMSYLDENRPEGKMCLSNSECEEIEKAFLVGDWEKIERYFHKYQWKPSEEQEEPEYYQHFDPDC